MERNPYYMLEGKPTFALSSTDITDGEQMPLAQLSTRLGGEDKSPHLKWSGFPDGTKSFALTVYDPDAPTPSGFWHWAVYNLPSDTVELVAGAGNNSELLPSNAVAVKNDRSLKEFIGAAPPPKTGRHRYFFVVYALDTEKLDLPEDATPTFLTFNLLGHTLAWAQLKTWYEQ